MFPTAVAFVVVLLSTLAVSNMLFAKKKWDPQGKVRVGSCSSRGRPFR